MVPCELSEYWRKEAPTITSANFISFVKLYWPSAWYKSVLSANLAPPLLTGILTALLKACCYSLLPVKKRPASAAARAAACAVASGAPCKRAPAYVPVYCANQF